MIDFKESKLAKGIIAEGGNFGTMAAVKALKSRRVRDIELTTLEVGDVIEFPENIDKAIGEQIINGRKAPFVGVSLYRGSEEIAFQMFPGSFERSIAEVADDGTRTGNRVSASGTAVEDYQTAATQYEGLKKFEGKKITVSAITEVQTTAFGSIDLVMRNVYTFDYIE